MLRIKCSWNRESSPRPVHMVCFALLFFNCNEPFRSTAIFAALERNHEYAIENYNFSKSNLKVIYKAIDAIIVLNISAFFKGGMVYL